MEVILVPGFWLDGSAWDEVLPPIEAAGHRVRALTLPGMESRDADRSGVTLQDHVDAVVAAVDAAEGPVVLVAHSGGASPVHAAVDARPDRVVRAVYVDTWPTGDGNIVNDELPSRDGEIPLPDWSVFPDEDLVGLDDAGRERLRARAIPTPLHVAVDRQRLSDPRRYDVPVTVIACEFPSGQLQKWMLGGEPALQELAAIRDVTYADLPTGHWPMFTRPQELGEAIAAAVG